jgi:hypothetical protein
MAAVAPTLEPGDPHFEFLYWARQLFEHNALHIQQPAYLCDHKVGSHQAASVPLLVSWTVHWR